MVGRQTIVDRTVPRRLNKRAPASAPCSVCHECRAAGRCTAADVWPLTHFCRSHSHAFFLMYRADTTRTSAFLKCRLSWTTPSGYKTSSRCLSTLNTCPRFDQRYCMASSHKTKQDVLTLDVAAAGVQQELWVRPAGHALCAAPGGATATINPETCCTTLQCHAHIITRCSVAGCQSRHCVMLLLRAGRGKPEA